MGAELTEKSTQAESFQGCFLLPAAPLWFCWGGLLAPWGHRAGEGLPRQ